MKYYLLIEPRYAQLNTLHSQKNPKHNFWGAEPPTLPVCQGGVRGFHPRTHPLAYHVVYASTILRNLTTWYATWHTTFEKVYQEPYIQ